MRCASWVGAAENFGLAPRAASKRFEDAARSSPEHEFAERNYNPVMWQVFNPMFVQRIRDGGYDSHPIRKAAADCEAKFPK